MVETEETPVQSEETAGLKLDLGAGKNPREGFVPVDCIAFRDDTVVVELCKPVYAPLPDGFTEDMVKDFGIAFERRIVGYEPWPWEDGSVDEVHCSHFLEHLTAGQRVHFFNELYRVLKDPVYDHGKAVVGVATIVTPHWSSCRAYGDYTHQWPPVSDFFWYYLSRKWRLGVENSDKPDEGANAPHTDAKYVAGGYDCDFECSWGYSMTDELAHRAVEYQQFALSNYRDAAQDTVCTVVKKP